jgi:O-acetyl-ADP-ribose deacetylase (regulator of RNase III)
MGNITYTTGDLTQSDATYLINTVNCVGVSGTGLALSFAQRFPETIPAYKNACRDGSLRPGHPVIHPLTPNRFVVQFPTKADWRNPSELPWIDQGLRRLAQAMQSRTPATIAVPPLGCRNGGLNWRDVHPLVVQHLGPIAGLDVVIYGSRIQETVPRLDARGAPSASPGPLESHTEGKMAQAPLPTPALVPAGFTMIPYTGIGSRNTPPEICQRMTKLARWLEARGFLLRSGRAIGADQAFEAGVTDPRHMAIWLPRTPFEGVSAGGCYRLVPKAIKEQARAIAASVHPNWAAVERLERNGKPFAAEAHIRNTLQVLGSNLNLPSRFLICWAPPEGDSVKGGTKTAFELARRFNIPTFNVAVPEQALRLNQLLKTLELEVIAQVQRANSSNLTR